MPAYAIAMFNVKDPAKFEEYTKLASPIVAEFGGRLVARGGIAAAIEGDPQGERVVVIEFPSVEAAKTCYGSPAYLQARSKRIDAADFTLLIVESA